MARMIFVNLPVTDLARSTAFYAAIGATRNPQFSDDTAACMVVSDAINVMLLTHNKYRQFTSKAIADTRASSAVLLALSADSRGEVDAFVVRGPRRGLRRHGRPGTGAGPRLHVRPQRRGSRRPCLGSDVDGHVGGAGSSMMRTPAAA